MTSLAETIVVLDLDDTLYAEEDYVRSGIDHVCGLVMASYGLDLLATARDARDRRADWLDAVCDGLPPSDVLKPSLLWAYRTHAPAIRLTEPMRRILDQLRIEAAAVAILTDGRSLTQRLKLRALGLEAWPTFISDEFGGRAKPDPARFEAVASRYPAARHVYVADNPAKDFQAPLTLGWHTIGYEGFVPRRTGQAMPHQWVGSPETLLSALRGDLA